MVFSGEGWTRLAADFEATIQRRGTIYLAGCGSTGRLSIILDALWRKTVCKLAAEETEFRSLRDIESRVVSVMAGGDFALIRAVEGFEDFETFGRGQISALGLTSRDTVVSITGYNRR